MKKSESPKMRKGARSTGSKTVPAKKSRKAARKGATKATMGDDDRIATYLALIGTEVARGLGDIAKALAEVSRAIRDEVEELDVPQSPATVTVEPS